MARRRRSTSVIWLVILMLVFAIGIGYAAFYYSRDLGKGVTAPAPKPSVKVEQVTGKPTLSARKVKIFLPKATETDTYLAPVTRTSTAKGDILDLAVNMLLLADQENGEGRMFPEGTKLSSSVKLENGVAVVDFNSAITGFSGSSTQEALMLNSLAQTVVANSAGKVKQVQILVEGETVESLGGHLEITDPIVPDSAMLQPANQE